MQAEAEAIRRIGGAYSRTRLTPRVRRLFEPWLRDTLESAPAFHNREYLL